MSRRYTAETKIAGRSASGVCYERRAPLAAMMSVFETALHARLEIWIRGGNAWPLPSSPMACIHMHNISESALMDARLAVSRLPRRSGGYHRGHIGTVWYLSVAHRAIAPFLMCRLCICRLCIRRAPLALICNNTLGRRGASHRGRWGASVRGGGIWMTEARGAKRIRPRERRQMRCRRRKKAMKKART